MHSHRIEVFDTADNDAVIGVVTHHFKFVFFPTNDGCLHENLTNRTCIKTIRSQLRELFHGVCDARALATQDVGRADDDW